ncbi:MAG: hypothetical protein IIB53_06320 [Planctomycetes bacterium]|nr:hypothetical protein [Planctomycetota bacterium]
MKNLNTTVTVVLAATFLMTFSSSTWAQLVATGQPIPSVAQVQFDVDDWTFVPTMAGSRVDSILALRDQSTIVGSNISTVWFRRGTNSWIAMAWSDPDQSKAIGHVKQELGISDKYDDLWPVMPESEGTTTPALFKNGVFIDDPLVAVIEASLDPQATVDNLVAVGAAAASIQLELLDLTNNCDESLIFEALAEGIELQMSGQGDGEDHAYTGIQTLGCISFCIRWTWTISGPTLIGCNCAWGGASSNEWMAIHCAMICHFNGTSTCTYTRTRKRRTWSCTTCTWTETRTKTGDVQCTSTEYFIENGCVDPRTLPGGYTCPPGPDCSCPQPGGNITWTPWTGNPPC